MTNSRLTYHVITKKEAKCLIYFKKEHVVSDSDLLTIRCIRNVVSP